MKGVGLLKLHNDVKYLTLYRQKDVNSRQQFGDFDVKGDVFSRRIMTSNIWDILPS